jgi:CubicO group peptidase (beta-lactamase class C family)
VTGRHGPAGPAGSWPDRGAERLDAAVRAGLTRTGTPGAVVEITVDAEVVAAGAWGVAHRGDDRHPDRPMTADTIHDVASITKLVATTAVAYRLARDGSLDLDARVSSWLPELGDVEVTVADLLGHTAGLPAWAPLMAAATRGVDPLVAIGAELAAARARGVARGSVTYSDLGMAALGRLLERATDRGLPELLHDLVALPLGWRDTGYGPLSVADRARAAATSHGEPAEAALLVTRSPELARQDPRRWPWWRDRIHVGEVDDVNAAVAFGGVAGHAGVFATAADLTRAAVALWRLADAPDAVTGRFLTPGPDAAIGLGVWRRRLAAALGRAHPAVTDGDASLGHRGFTGCELLADPSRRLTVVLASNRLHGTDPRTGGVPDHAGLWVPLLATVVDLVDGRT